MQKASRFNITESENLKTKATNPRSTSALPVTPVPGEAAPFSAAADFGQALLLTSVEEDLLSALHVPCLIEHQVGFGFPKTSPAYSGSLANVLPRAKGIKRNTAETIGTARLPGDAMASDRGRHFALEVSLLENYCPRAVTVRLGRCRSSIKAGPSPHSLIHFSRLRLLVNKVHLQPQAMSCYSPCMPCRPCGPTPLANSCNEPCVRQCQDSNVVIQPSAVVVTLPGPILSSFPQNTAVGSSTSAAVGSILSSEGVPINSGGFSLSGLGSGICGRRCFPC
ncbi:uncharacterized protein LOC129782656 [Falco peregrinus]|uniref:uncharacterized protein LOC129782656 n=1 Tax=Falco peregrinus TaxID=8954 RepID=UPI002479264C|nr:uncharacterized protein LOC129782656 [Falco peregrinus]